MKWPKLEDWVSGIMSGLSPWEHQERREYVLKHYAKKKPKTVPKKRYVNVYRTPVPVVQDVYGEWDETSDGYGNEFMESIDEDETFDDEDAGMLR